MNPEKQLSVGGYLNWLTVTNESDTDNKVKGRGKGEKLNMNCTKRTIGVE